MTFTRPAPARGPGFTVLAGRHNGLHDLMLLSGHLLAGDLSPVHAHQGDEVLRVVSGAMQVRVGDEVRKCRDGDVAVIGPGVPHGFRVLTETRVEVLCGYGIGMFYPVPGVDGEEWVEVHRRDVPWGRPPTDGATWTTDEELTALVARVVREV